MYMLYMLQGWFYNIGNYTLAFFSSIATFENGDDISYNVVMNIRDNIHKILSAKHSI